MVKFVKTIKGPLFKIMKKPSYLLLTLFIAFLLVSITTLIINYQLIFNILFSSKDVGFKLSFLLNMLGGIITNNTEISLLTLVVTGILAGLNVSFLVFKFKANKNTEKKR